MKKWIVILILTVTSSLLCSCLPISDEKEHPRDEELIENFQSHKAEFNQLLQMFQEDKSIGRVAFNFTRTSSFFEKCKSANSWDGKTVEPSDERLAEYRRLFKVLDLSKGIEGYCEKNIIWFYSSSRGLSVSGSSKGFAYVLEKPEITVDSLNDYRFKNDESSPAFRHIEGNWYLFLD